ncbi:FAD-dependent monooxygenase [Pseudonocardia abyssalis]|uniref:FAD-dependent monooxygenase n=1 Tax=Pseudonocardia abyssalis TaxID=2792008 RepID=A0ABS6UQX4_9PSEU|nr:FAD-dependent monooxygenase [Pseudonocardia abyssalis]MBW0119255.1 FAD-dependent monooxygenase [Pseudonocardia abyssalis]MBW0134665.1 FAD-dependent monooxygenase [Pseudonocardia abyssalis]
MTEIVPDVLVVGGGIGGLTTALCAVRRGLSARVLEQAATYGEIGAGIQLAPNATRVLDRLGLLDRIRDVGVLPRRLVLAHAGTGRELTHLPLTDFPQRYGGPYVVLHRSDLLAALLDACRDAGVALETGARADHVTDTGDRVEVRCTDGRGFAGGVLLAADGLHSRIRPRLVVDEPVCSGYVAYRGAVPLERVQHRSDLDDVVVFLGPGRHLVQYPLRARTLYNQVAVFRSPGFARGETDWGGPDELDAAFAGSCGHVRGAITAVGRDARWPMYDRPPTEHWVRGRIGLLGDAAHPMLQYLAQGACQAVEDADAVTGALASSPPAEALRRYAERRVPRATRVQTTARQWGELWHLDGPAADARDALLVGRAPDDHGHVGWLYG